MKKKPLEPAVAFRITGSQRSIAQKELNVYVGTLCHDQQYDVQRSVTIIRILALPMKISVATALKRLHDMLAVTRARENWGRPWSQRQLERIYFQKSEAFKRRSPHPVIEEELKFYKPKRVPGRAAKEALREAMRIERAGK